MSFITVSQAATLIDNYKELRTEILKTGYSTDILPICLTVPKGEVESMLSQTGADSLRIYLGAVTTTNLITAVLVAVNETDDDIIDSENPLIIDNLSRCPSSCPPASDINP